MASKPKPMNFNGTNNDDTFVGGEGNDHINGKAGNDNLDGAGGKDKINGGKGNDMIAGGAGNDDLKGGDGNDNLYGGAGNDKIDGGKGDDTAYYSGNRSDYTFSFKKNGDGTITDNRANSPDGTDSLKNVEHLHFADGTYDVDTGNFYYQGTYTLPVQGINRDGHALLAGENPDAYRTLADGTKMNTEARSGAITTERTAGDDGNGALHLVTDNSGANGPNNGRLRVNDVYDSDNQFKLGDLHTLSFDYNVAASDRTDIIPTIRIKVDVDGNTATTNDQAELVFEYAYQGMGPVTKGSWQHVDLAAGDWIAWEGHNGHNHDGAGDFHRLSEWQSAAGAKPISGDGGLQLNADSTVIGWSIADGSYNGVNSMFIDHLKVGTVTYDFQV